MEIWNPANVALGIPSASKQDDFSLHDRRVGGLADNVAVHRSAASASPNTARLS